MLFGVSGDEPARASLGTVVTGGAVVPVDVCRGRAALHRTVLLAGGAEQLEERDLGAFDSGDPVDASNE